MLPTGITAIVGFTTNNSTFGAQLIIMVVVQSLMMLFNKCIPAGKEVKCCFGCTCLNRQKRKMDLIFGDVKGKEFCIKCRDEGRCTFTDLLEMGADDTTHESELSPAEASSKISKVIAIPLGKRSAS